MLTAQYRSTLQPRVTEKQSRLIEHKRMAALAREDRARMAAATAPHRPGMLARLLGRRARPASAEPQVTIWLDPVAGLPWAAPAERAVATVVVAQPVPQPAPGPAQRVVA